MFEGNATELAPFSPQLKNHDWKLCKECLIIKQSQIYITWLNKLNFNIYFNLKGIILAQAERKLIENYINFRKNV